MLAATNRTIRRGSWEGAGIENWLWPGVGFPIATEAVMRFSIKSAAVPPNTEVTVDLPETVLTFWIFGIST